MPTFPILLRSRKASGRQTSHSLAKIFPLFAPPFSILSIRNNNAPAAPPCLPMPYSCGGFHIFCGQTRKTVLVDVELFLNYLALSDLQRKRITTCIQNHCGLMSAIAMPKICNKSASLLCACALPCTCNSSHGKNRREVVAYMARRRAKNLFGGFREREIVYFRNTRFLPPN